MDDMISRQQAIDAVLNNEHSTDITLMGDAFGKGYTEGYKEEQNNVLQYLADLPSAQPEQHIDEWCTDCKEYDTDRHCCPRWNKVIRQTLADAQPEQPNLSEAYANAVFTWLMSYQIQSAQLKGRYTPYEVIGWVLNDWRKEHDAKRDT